jgi:hypothetical protein
MKSNTIIKVIEIVYFGKSSRKEGTIEMILYKYGLGLLYTLKPQRKGTSQNTLPTALANRNVSG